jgi:predicted GH43/DUF377 family glycosyl hydrolase
MISWNRKGLIFKNIFKNRSHTQLPIAIKLKKKIRVYYSSRDYLGRSEPFYFDLSLDLKKIIKCGKKPILKLGEIGSFDESGIMPTGIIKTSKNYLLYYIGWQKSFSVPFINSLGLAISKNGLNFKKYSESPILNRNDNERFFFGTAHVVKNKEGYLMYYLSGIKWKRINKRIEPFYDIKIAKSKNGYDWKQIKKTAIILKKSEGGVCSASVIKKDKKYFMYYCYRGKSNYRNNKKYSYRIGCASSKDLIKWKRADHNFNLEILENSWESKMMAYPNIIKLNKNYLMFYNGNEFGKSGIGLAISN